ncbi:MAG: rRNA maturation RNase YbeY [Candidatus Parcubacteria bacterium]|nr:rRNA maturation RNase YbeY [Candidatus Parcubacteria bacterium]
MKYNIFWELKAKQPKDFKLLGKIVESAARVLKIESKKEISVIIVGSGKMRSLNKQYRHQDKVTDVLSFSQQGGLALNNPEEPLYLGDIIICYAQVIKQAKVFGFSREKELAFLIIHGLLHLLGYQDKNQKQYLKMETIQNKILSYFYD